MLIDEPAVRARVAELAAQIEHDYAGRDPLLLFIMKGALIFVSDLVRQLRCNPRLDFMVVSSYGSGTASSGSVRIVADLKTDIRGRDVLIVEDIVDSGLTLQEVVAHLQVRSPASIEICTLLSKPARRQTDVSVRYVGFEIDDVFVVGYGLDLNERFRGLPYVGVLDAGKLPSDS